MLHGWGQDGAVTEDVAAGNLNSSTFTVLWSRPIA